MAIERMVHAQHALPMTMHEASDSAPVLEAVEPVPSCLDRSWTLELSSRPCLCLNQRPSCGSKSLRQAGHPQCTDCTLLSLAQVGLRGAHIGAGQIHQGHVEGAVSQKHGLPQLVQAP